jgi:ParB family chromosome partitioning protein
LSFELTQNTEPTTATIHAESTPRNNPASIYYSAKSVEWYTPIEIVESARKVLGEIDVDPASCPRANFLVQAKTYFTKEDDGLSKPWFGKVWLNPPFGRLGPKFAKKLVSEYESGSVHEAIFLANANALTAAWFHPLLDYPICVPRGRTKFWNQNGIGEAPGNGSLLVYLGTNPEKFAEHFGQFGAIIAPFRSWEHASLGVAA